MRPKIYLSGAIEKSKSPFGWRLEMKESLEADYDVIVPDSLKLPPDCSFIDKQKIMNYPTTKDGWVS
jgi:hypothetical protein